MQLAFPLPELQPIESAFSPPRVQRIFCNRSLRLDQIDWVGFDMDYTLAIYDRIELDRLQISATVEKLIERGYPEALRTLDIRPDFAVRGLHVDKKTGNVLKMDRYRYVKKAYHGTQRLSREERRALYHAQRIRMGPRYHWVDTLYALVEVSMYASVVQHLETLGAVDYGKVFEDIRDCIDRSHQDGTILDHVLADLPRYVKKDPALGPTLHKLRSAGKKLFLLTNSQPAYTDRMMEFLLGGANAEYLSWRHYFDVAISAARKPKFFTGEDPFLEVLPDGAHRPVTRFERGRMYLHGNIAALEAHLGTATDRILYVGDHIYGDVLRAKKETGWRTIMVLQEMGDETAAIDQTWQDQLRIDGLEQSRQALYDELRSRQRRIRDLSREIEPAQKGESGSTEPSLWTDLESARTREKRAIERVRASLRAVEDEITTLEERVDDVYHPFWGSTLKCGPETSSFGDQIERFACLYTERVSNLLGYSPMHYFQSPRDRMPHEM